MAIKVTIQPVKTVDAIAAIKSTNDFTFRYIGNAP